MKLSCLFSLSDECAYEGFIAYRVNGNEVTGIKTFSLNLKHKDFTYQSDLKDFIEHILLPKYSRISWAAIKRNSANRAYRRIINELNGEQYPKFDKNYPKLPDSTIINYWIEKSSRTTTK